MTSTLQENFEKAQVQQILEKVKRKETLSSRETEIANRYFRKLEREKAEAEAEISEPTPEIESPSTKLAKFNEELGFVEPPEHLNQAERRFIWFYVQGVPPLGAYKECFPNARKFKYPKIRRHINEILQHPKSRAYIAGLNARLDDLAIATQREVQMWLTTVLRTPIGSIDANHPICQKRTIKRRFNKWGDQIAEDEELETVDKLAAAQTLSKMKGWDAPAKIDVNHSVGVMVVPATADEATWESLASEQQENLLTETIDV